MQIERPILVDKNHFVDMVNLKLVCIYTMQFEDPTMEKPYQFQSNWLIYANNVFCQHRYGMEFYFFMCH